MNFSNPSIDKILATVDNNRFRIVLAVASRARAIDDHRVIPLVDEANKKSISVALEELAEMKISISN